MTRFDAVVIGTGFGGAVTGTRLAQGGMRVLLLERGPWWGPAAADVVASAGREFPRGPWNSRKLLRNMRYTGRRRSVDLSFNTDGLYEIHRFPAISVLSASGVGGGSHTYAAVQREPEASYWEGFPPEITQEEMAPYFAKVNLMQHPAPAPLRATHRPLTVALSRSGMAMESPDVAIDHTTCHRCSRCVVGCPHGAKTTLDLTYLPAARSAGAQIWPLCEATELRSLGTGYEVTCRDHRTRTTMTVRTPRLILAAGTLNTVRLLLEAKGTGLPRLSPRLGSRFSSNADYPLVVRRPRSGQASSGVLVNSAATRDGRYYLDADLPFTSQRLQLLVGMGDDDSPASLFPIPGGITSDAGRQLACSMYQRMDADLAAVCAAENLRAIGSPRRLLSAHPLGGAAMATSPQAGVVDHTGQVFGHPRLHVVDGAVLPRAPGVPPSLTIAALAERSADLILQGDHG